MIQAELRRELDQAYETIRSISNRPSSDKYAMEFLQTRNAALEKEIVDLRAGNGLNDPTELVSLREKLAEVEAEKFGL